MTPKEKIIQSFDPNAPGGGETLFGLPFGEAHSELILIPVPWEVTVSYKPGTAAGPQAILAASAQVDLYLKDIPDAWQMGMHMLPIDNQLARESKKNRELAAKYIHWLEENEEEWISDELKVIPTAINKVAETLNIWVRSKAEEHMRAGKMVGLIGGDHSTPLGLIQALTRQNASFGILQIDAHADLRAAYENFRYSHASIMYNALELDSVSKLVQVGIRDYCEEEMEYIRKAEGRVVTFFDADIKSAAYEGVSWATQCQQIVAALPDKVYISFDIDGLDPKLCPNTGTPVPGGFEFEQVLYLIKTVVRSGRKIIGFDINEVCPGEDEWDANVGARLLYNMGSLMGVSQGKLTLKD